MTRFAALAFVTALLSASAAHATFGGSCCACIVGAECAVAQPSGTNQTAQTMVLFCAESVDTSPLAARCEALSPGAGLHCEANIPGPTCRQQLADSGIACPVAGAPAAAPLNLAALAVALGALGTVVLRHRLGRGVSEKERP